MSSRPTSRRSFFGLAGGAALLCTIGGKEINVSAPNGLKEADGTAAALRRPKAAASQAVPQIQPAPGGVRREYWVQAETVKWAITPNRRDEWHNRRLAGRNVFTAYVYRLMTPGFAGYAIDHPTIPGPTLTAEVGDVLVVHFRNADRKLNTWASSRAPAVSSRPARRSPISGSACRSP
jgi:hypothetical protein